MKRRSFRLKLAIWIGSAVLAVFLIAAALAYRSLHDLLYDQLDTTLLRLAAIEAAAASDTRDSAVHFHDEAFLASGPSGEGSLDRYAEVWTVSGNPVIRTRNLGTTDLPLDPAALDRVVRSDTPFLTTAEWQGSTYRSILYPLGLVGPQHRPHVLQVVASADPTESLLAGFLRRLVAAVSFGTAAAFGIGWWIAGRAIRPITRIVEQAEEVQMTGGAHGIEARADTEEIERLIDVLNSMLARIDAAFESQRRFLADVGHEIRTPLTVLRGEIEVALMRPRTAEEYERILRKSLEDLRAASTLAGDLTCSRGARAGDLSRSSSPSKQRASSMRWPMPTRLVPKLASRSTPIPDLWSRPIPRSSGERWRTSSTMRSATAEDTWRCEPNASDRGSSSASSTTGPASRRRSAPVSSNDSTAAVLADGPAEGRASVSRSYGRSPRATRDRSRWRRPRAVALLSSFRCRPPIPCKTSAARHRRFRA